MIATLAKPTGIGRGSVSLFLALHCLPQFLDLLQNLPLPFFECLETIANILNITSDVPVLVKLNPAVVAHAQQKYSTEEGGRDARVGDKNRSKVLDDFRCHPEQPEPPYRSFQFEDKVDCTVE